MLQIFTRYTPDWGLLTIYRLSQDSYGNQPSAYAKHPLPQPKTDLELTSSPAAMFLGSRASSGISWSVSAFAFFLSLIILPTVLTTPGIWIHGFRFLRFVNAKIKHIFIKPCILKINVIFVVRFLPLKQQIGKY